MKMSIKKRRNQRELISAQDANASAPVSYTHLDVYKRQGLLRASADPAAQLMQLAESKALGVFHHHDDCVGYIHRCV